MSRVVHSCLRLIGSIAFFIALGHCAAAQDSTPTASQNFNQFLHQVAAVDTFLTPGGSAAFSQFVSRPLGFDGGIKGYGEHYGIALADNVGGKFVRAFAFPTLFRQNVNYAPDRSATFWRRVGHAAQHSLFLTTPGSPGLRVNFSGAPASLVTAAVSNAYQPVEQRTWSATFARSGTNAAGYLLGDLVTEFKPELCVVPKLIHIPCS